jgi:hypothetical protein
MLGRLAMPHITTWKFTKCNIEADRERRRREDAQHREALAGPM